MIKQSTKKSRKKAVLVILSIVILFAIFAILELKGRAHTLKQTKSPQLIPVSAVQTPSQTVTNTVSKETNTPSTNTASNTQTQTNGSITLVKPYGIFVSTHKPNSTGQILSTCNTSPSTSCTIEFTKGSETKKLPDQITSGDGTTSWLWNVSQAGLSVGSWQIKVIASLNNQSLSTVDQTNLEVQP